MDNTTQVGDIVIVSGSYGAGHDAAADALALTLRTGGHTVRQLDVAELLPWRIGVVLRWLYFAQLRWLPGSWGSTLRVLEGDGVVFRCVRRILGLLGSRLVADVHAAHLVIATHPFAAQALGEARARKALDAHVVTYLTDASAHRLWVHASVDLHLAIHEVAARQARELGGDTRVIAAVVPRRPGAAAGWTPPWSPERPVALVVGGSCGVGDLEGSALDVLETGLMTPVVLCGSNERLRLRLEALPGIVALGWREDMDELIGAASCVVQNAGGMTSLESLATGTPTVTYRPIAGHGMTNATALAAAGLIPWPIDPVELEAALLRVLVSPGSFSLPQGAPSVLAVLEDSGLAAVRAPLVAA